MAIANKKASGFVQRCEPFKGSNLSGEWVGEYYVVYSYGWFPLFVRDRRGYWIENNESFSASTTRQKSSCRPCSSLETCLDPYLLKKFYREAPKSTAQVRK